MYTILADANGVAAPGFTAAEAYAIDSKVDDGYALSGRIYAIRYALHGWANPSSANAAIVGTTPSSCAADINGGSASGLPWIYNIKNGVGPVCILDIGFQ
jgi:hypothetical protein